MIIGRTKARLISELIIDADIDMATHKLTGLGAGAGAGHSLQYQQAIRQAILTAQGDMIYRDGGLAKRLSKGTVGHYLKQGATIPEWAAAYLVDLLTAQGDLVTRSNTAPKKLAKGTAGHYLKQGANEPEWAALPTPLMAASGLYTGNGAANRAIAHGLGVVPKFVFILLAATDGEECKFFGSAPTKNVWSNPSGGDVIIQTAMDATNFYVGDTADRGNADTYTYLWFAIG